MSYELKDFQKDVIGASRSVPVVIDFWAEWCGPCRQLSPIIEKLAGEADGQWKLVKINTEKHQDIAIQFGVRGIPAVKMVYEEEIIAEFTGAQPEHLIRKWLKENLPGNGRGSSGELDKELNTLIAEGNRQQARELLEEEVTEESDSRLKAKLAMMKLPDDMEGAKEWIDQVRDDKKYKIEVESFEFVKHLEKVADGEWSSEEENSETAALYGEAAEMLFNMEFEQALEKFIECIQLDRSLDDDGARRACVAIFSMLGQKHPLTLKYRRSFSMSLY